MALRRLENVSATWQRGLAWLFTGKGYVTVRVGRQAYRRPGGVAKQEWNRWVGVSDADQPVSFISVGERRYWRFEGRWYADNEDLTAEEVRALLITRGHVRRSQINRAQTIAAMAEAPSPAAVRGAIPDDLRMLVWTRDRGQCRRCGSMTEIQFDHIIPVSRGGATSPENLELLCGPCNRRKGAAVASPSRPAAAEVPRGAGLPPAGWYADPSGAPRQRYWDGSNWTGRYA